MQSLLPKAARLASLLKARGETIAVSESSSGGLLAAALLAQPGASAYFRGGAVVYTPAARAAFLRITPEDMAGMRSATEPYALLLARTLRDNLGTDWGLSETGAAGPTGNRYGDAAGHCCLGLAGAIESSTTLETASHDRLANMRAFAGAALDMMVKALEK